MALNKRKEQYYYEHKQIDTGGAHCIDDDPRRSTVLVNDYTIENINGAYSVSTMVETKTDGSYLHRRTYIFYTEQEALDAFDADVQNIYAIYGRA